MARLIEPVHSSVLIFFALFFIWNDSSRVIAASDITTIDGYIWLDMDQDGLRDDEELGVNKIVVNLLEPLTNLTLQRVTTDLSGSYEFQVVPGQYKVLFEVQAHALTTNQYANRTSGSHVDPGRESAFGLTDIIHTSADQEIVQQNVGLLPATIGGQAWLDYNRNGSREEQELMIPELQVNLLDVTNGRQAGSMMTDALGIYTFTVPPGNYLVEFVAPPESFTTWFSAGAGYSHAIPNESLQVGQTEPIHLSFGEGVNYLDVGLLPATISDTVWLDLNNNGEQDEHEFGLSELLVTLWDSEGNLLQSTLTDELGIYHFVVEPSHNAYVVQLNSGQVDIVERESIRSVGLEITESMENRIVQDGNSFKEWLEHAQSLQKDMWIESQPITVTYGEQHSGVDIDLQPAQIGGSIWHDHNGNGLRETDDEGWDGLQIILFDAVSGVETQRTFSAEDGSYLFQAAPGTYAIGFEKERNMLFSHYSPFDDGQMAAVDLNKTSYSHVNPQTELIEGIVANLGELRLDNDAGIYRTATLGDWVWLDRDGDGLQDEGEMGLADLPLSLYNSQNELVAQTFSDSNGFYRFNNLTPDRYYVVTSLSTDYLISPVDQDRSDKNDNDLSPSLERTDFVTITSGNIHMMLDIGLTKPCTLQSYVWFDADRDGVRELGEDGVSDVTVTLYDEWNQQIRSTRTDEEGVYQFADIPPAIYTVAFDKPIEFDFAPLAQGDSSELDSDVDPYSGRTILFQLYAEETNEEWGAGLVTPRDQIDLLSFTAHQSSGTEVILEWETSHVISENGFRIYNSTEPDLQNAQRINESIERNQQRQQTYSYQVKQQIEAVIPDPDAIEVTELHTAYYWLVDIENGVEIDTYGPVEVVIQPFEDLFLPLVYR